MTDKEKKPTAQEIQKATREIDSLLEKPEFFDLLSNMTEDHQLFGKASANPREFLKKKGLVVPSNIDLTFEKNVVALKIKVTITICVTFCIVIRGFLICRRACASGTVVIG
jgi:hypothetical protein